jgi:hypothetical protein
MKPMNGNAEAIKKGLVTAEEMLRYAMSLPVTTTICGIDSPEILRQDLQIAQNFQPLSAEEMDEIRGKCAVAAGDGRFELYKMTLAYDNPQARLVHHFPLDQQQKEIKDMFEGNLTASPI